MRPLRPADLGQTVVVRFPAEDERANAGYHIEGSYAAPDGSGAGWVNIRSRARGLLELFLFTDTGRHDAPTRLLCGSHLTLHAEGAANTGPFAGVLAVNRVPRLGVYSRWRGCRWGVAGAGPVAVQAAGDGEEPFVRMLVMGALGGVAVAGTLAALGAVQAGAAVRIAPVPSARPVIVSYRAAGGPVAAAAGPDGVAASGDYWGKAIEVPGTASLNVGGDAGVGSVSCTSGDYCAAAGNYGSDPRDRGITRVFVVSRWRGRWGKAGQVPGLASFGGGGAEVSSQAGAVSCASPGNCAVGGSFLDQYADPEGFVASERDGRWGDAIRATGRLLSTGPSEVYSVSCPSAGNCEAAGYYFDGGLFIGDSQAFVVSEQNGRWGQAIEIPGLAALNAGDRARAYSISCASAGNCAAGGFYLDAAGHWQAFVASQRNGRWSPAIEVPGMPGLNAGGQATVDSVSCSSPGNCAAGGYYEASAYNGSTATWQAFVVSQRNGTWGTAVPVLRTASVNDNTPGAATESVSCPSRGPSSGRCAAAGAYLDSAGHVQAFTVGQRDGRWGKAVQVPGTSALNRGGDAQVFSVSCQSAGNCGAAGFYLDGRGRAQAFAATERNGHWGNAVKMPGTATLNTGGNAALLSESCPAAGRCGAGGYYNDSGHLQAFVASRTRR